jgi:hypothetical protein
MGAGHSVRINPAPTPTRPTPQELQQSTPLLISYYLAGISIGNGTKNAAIYCAIGTTGGLSQAD